MAMLGAADRLTDILPVAGKVIVTAAALDPFPVMAGRSLRFAARSPHCAHPVRVEHLKSLAFGGRDRSPVHRTDGIDTVVVQ
jgi:hypothetical protein